MIDCVEPPGCDSGLERSRQLATAAVVGSEGRSAISLPVIGQRSSGKKHFAR